MLDTEVVALAWSRSQFGVELVRREVPELLVGPHVLVDVVPGDELTLERVETVRPVLDLVTSRRSVRKLRSTRS